MKDYISNHKRIRAIQFEGTRVSAEEICTEFGFISTLHSIDGSAFFTADNHLGNTRINKGQFIYRTDCRCLTICNKEIFFDKFREVSKPNPEYSLIRVKSNIGDGKITTYPNVTDICDADEDFSVKFTYRVGVKKLQVETRGAIIHKEMIVT